MYTDFKLCNISTKQYQLEMAHYSHSEPLPYSNMNHYEEPHHTSASKGCTEESYMEPYATIGQPMLELESYGDTKATSGDGFIHMYCHVMSCNVSGFITTTLINQLLVAFLPQKYAET